MDTTKVYILIDENYRIMGIYSQMQKAVKITEDQGTILRTQELGFGDVEVEMVDGQRYLIEEWEMEREG